MTEFRVHFKTENGAANAVTIEAETPEKASNTIRKRYPGAIITKVKVDKSGNVSPRVRSEFIPFYKPGEAEKITETGKFIIADVVRATGLTVQEMINTYNINGKSGTVIVDELSHWETVGDPRPRHR